MAQEPIRNSINLLIAVGGFVAKPGLLAALKTGQSIHDTLKTMTAAPPPEMSNLTAVLIESAQRIFESTPHLPPDAVILFEQMVEFGLPDAQEIVEANLQADAICTTMQNKLSKLGQLEFREPPMPDLFRSITVPVFEKLLAEKRFSENLMPAWMAAISGDMNEIKNLIKKQSLTQSQTEALQKELARAKAEQGATNSLLQGFLKTIFGRHVPPEEFAETLFQMAADWKSAGKRISALGAFDDNSPRLERLKLKLLTAYQAEDTEQVWSLLTEIEQEQSAYLQCHEDKARRVRENLIETKSAKLAISASQLDVSKSVALVLEKLKLEGGGFDDLRAAQDIWYKRGRDKGLRFNLEVAIALAQESVKRAMGPDQRGITLNDLGVAQKTLGEQESGAERLELAIATHKAALLEHTRDRMPLDWAMTQMNMGNAMQTLGAREANNDRLEQAVAAYKAALLELAPDRMPLDWAMTQMNLGVALRNLGERESGTARLHEAVAAHDAALLEYTRGRVPLDWAAAQINRGSALQTLGAREGNSDRLKCAIAAFEAALLEWTCDRVPLKYASVQMNLGNTLATLGEHEPDNGNWENAIAAHKAALLEWTKDRTPVNWALTQLNLSGVYLNWYNTASDNAHLDLAQGHLDQARAEFVTAQASHYLAKAEELQRLIDARRGAVG